MYCQTWAPTIKILIDNRLHHSTTYVRQPTLDNLNTTTGNQQLPMTAMTDNQQNPTSDTQQKATNSKEVPTAMADN
jgi:hypothetical protein